jgi:hypothetical protein
MNIDDDILINQIAQGIVKIEEGERWFLSLDLESKRTLLYRINAMILQAHPIPEDAISSVEASGLKKTMTPCVLLLRPGINDQLAKLANLPETELLSVFKLSVRLLGIADKRRRETKPVDTVNHWWHRDLKDPKVVAEIREYYRK